MYGCDAERLRLTLILHVVMIRDNDFKIYTVYTSFTIFLLSKQNQTLMLWYGIISLKEKITMNGNDALNHDMIQHRRDILLFKSKRYLRRSNEYITITIQNFI